MTAIPPAAAQAAKIFRALHSADDVLCLANAWDVATARLVEAVGATAIATTSAGVAWSLGVADGDHLDRAAAIGRIREIVAVTDARPVRVHRHPYDERDVVVVDLESGPVAVVETLRDAAYVFHLTAYGAEGHASMEIEDALGFYTGEMRAFAEMVRTGNPPVPAERTLDVLAILEAGERSAELNRAVEIVEIAGVPA